MKSLIWMPVGLAVAAGVALLVMRSTMKAPYVTETIVAAVIAVLACDLAVLPPILARRAHPATVSQTALLGTLIHMFLCISLAAVGYTMKLVPDRNAFLFLVLGFYWVSLIFIVTAMIRIIRQAAPSQQAPK